LQLPSLPKLPTFCHRDSGADLSAKPSGVSGGTIMYHPGPDCPCPHPLTISSATITLHEAFIKSTPLNVASHG
jgi:hypothetical protein